MGTQRQIAWQQDEGAHVESDAYYRAQWRAYAIRRGLALFFLFSWAPLAVGLFLLSRLWLHEPVLSLVVMILWLTAGCGMAYAAGEFRCPRCRRRYGALGHRKGDVNMTRGLFDNTCSNCKLRKFERVH